MKSIKNTKENIHEKTVKEPFLIPYAIAVLLVMISITVLLFYRPDRMDMVKINDINNVVENLPKIEINQIRAELANVIKENAEGNIRISRINDINIRGNSYRQNVEDGVQTTSFIVDIESLRQSFRIVNLYSLDGENSGDYRNLANCIFGNYVIFSEFEFVCQDRISLENGMPWADPIQYVLPYSTTFYGIRIGNSIPDKVGVNIVLNIADPEGTNETMMLRAEQIKREALDKIRELGFNPDDYIIEFSWRF